MAINITQTSGDRKGHKPRRIRRRWLLLLALVQLPVTAGVLIFGWLMFTSFKQQDFPIDKVGPYVALTDTFESVRAYRFPVGHWLGIDEDLPVVYLDIKQENYRALEYGALHDKAVNADLADGESIRRDVYVKADARYGSDTVPVKIRLKGDRALHWENPAKWSFRVDVRGERSLFGMKAFSLQKPVSRNYVYEWFFHKLLKREGLIGLKYDFVELHVNGKSQGIYAVEQHFDKILLEGNSRREAPILRFAEAGMGFDKDWYQMPVSPYGKKKWAERNPEMLRQATNLLENFQYGRLKVGEVFDIELLARYFAIIDLTDSFHGALAKSIKFYYNPINKKLEPIGFDAHFNDRKFPVLVAELSDFRNERGYDNQAYYEAFFGPDIADKIQFYEQYVRELERMSKPEFLDGLFLEIGPELDEKLDAIYSEIPWHDSITGHPLTTGARFLFYFSKQKLYDRQAFIRQHLAPPAAVTGYVEAIDEQHITLQMANAQKLPLEVLEVVHGGIVYQPAERLLLNEKPRYSPMDFSQYKLVAIGERPPIEEVKKPARLVIPKRRESAIRYRVPGSSTVSEHDLFDWSPAIVHEQAEMPYNRFMALEPRRFLVVDDVDRTINIKPGYWKITRDILIPEGYTLVGSPDTTLDLLNGSRLVSYSPLELSGTELDPFRFTSGDKTSKGLIVLEAEGRSTLNFVQFENQALADNEAWAIPGVVTFHRSDVDINNSKFGDNQSEDALNIIRSNFTISNSLFVNTFGDAFDSDFSEGRVDDTRYVNIGNDAIDVSGTTIVVRNVVVEGAGDKGLSVGESSRMDAEFVTLSNTNIGVAAKDQSHFEGMTLNIRQSKVGFALFQKKPEYGQATASVWRTQLSGVDEDYWLEEGSNLNWEGVPVAPNKTDLKKVLYADEYVDENEPAAGETK